MILPAPTSPPQNVRARPVSSSTVVVQWTEPEKANGIIKVCPASVYNFIPSVRPPDDRFTNCGIDADRSVFKTGSFIDAVFSKSCECCSKDVNRNLLQS